MPNPQDPRPHFTGPPPEGPPELPPVSPDDDATVRLGAAEPTVAMPPPEPVAPPVRVRGPAPVRGPEPAHGLRRFGPGVPGPDTSVSSSQTAAVWHGTLRPGDAAPAAPRRRRALRGWLLPVVVLLGVLAYLLWQRYPAPVKLDGVAVRPIAAVQGCHSTARVVGELRTSGGAGTVRYRWRRSDGTVSAELRQHVAKGDRTTEVSLLWTFDGAGSLAPTATLEVLAPRQLSAATTFAYACAG